jgi:hypothetical protein
MDPQQSIDLVLNVGDISLAVPGESWEPLIGEFDKTLGVIPPHGWAIGHICE